MTDATTKKETETTEMPAGKDAAATNAGAQESPVKTEISGEEPTTGESPPGESDAKPQVSDAEIEKLRQERDDLYNRYLRAVADLDNYRRRVQREKDELRQFAITDVVEGLLPIFENLNLAVASAKQASDPQSIVTGVSMVLEQFRSTLAGIGLVEINPAAGSDFDPHQHESLSHLPSQDVPAEKIVQVVRTGFSLKGRLLRPASVVLSSGPAAPAGESAEPPSQS